MKLISRIVFVLFTLVMCNACTDQSTYADELKAEKALIADFISRNGITVVETKPTTVPYPDKVYYKTSSGLYIHIKSVDTSVDTVATNDLVIFRYMQYTLGTNPDTISYMNTVDSPFPVTFYFNDLTQDQACTGWHEAISLMVYDNAEANIIVPSKLGFSTDEKIVVPYGYDIRIKIRK